mmetsp:Transcript_16216/g.39869  ORF Transcript_16216/g.39869 Transcript_16216/m.39869 type:complete len:235 (+) Transcript_16216:1454-2158(+)
MATTFAPCLVPRLGLKRGSVPGTWLAVPADPFRTRRSGRWTRRPRTLPGSVCGWRPTQICRVLRTGSPRRGRLSLTLPRWNAPGCSACVGWQNTWSTSPPRPSRGCPSATRPLDGSRELWGRWTTRRRRRRRHARQQRRRGAQQTSPSTRCPPKIRFVWRAAAGYQQWTSVQRTPSLPLPPRARASTPKWAPPPPWQRRRLRSQRPSRLSRKEIWTRRRRLRWRRWLAPAACWR